MRSEPLMNIDVQPDYGDAVKKFRSASDELYEIFSDTSLDNDAKLEGILELSLWYYGLDTAIVSSVAGANSVLSAITSLVIVPLRVGSTVLLSRMPDSECLRADKQFAEHQCKNGAYEYISGSQVLPVGSFIASVLHTVNGPYGSVCFSSKKSRSNSFDKYEWKFLSLVTNWLGYFLGNAEQLEFMMNQNEHYKTLFASIPAVMFLCDADGLVISSSDQFAQKIGLAVDMVPGKVCLSYFDENEKKSVRKAIAHGQAVQLPAKLLIPGGVSLEVELNISTKPIGTMRNIRMVIATDVSARNEALRAATEQNHLLEKSNEGLNRFAFVASHDLQEPLRKIQQFSSFLEEDLSGALDDDSKYHLNVIVDSSQRMSQLIKDLLSYSKASSVDPDMEPVCLKKLLASVTNELELLISEADASVEIGELPTVNGNSPLLRQLFTNLICNGIKYRSTERSPRLSVSCESANDSSMVCVSDNGIGFEMDSSKKIFEPFHRLHGAKEYQGTGIGLAICSAVCEKHGWDIEASSVLNEGSVFLINLKDK